VRSFGEHPHVGDIRGRGLLQAIELVVDPETKEPFDPALGLNARVKREAMARGLMCYPMGGTVDGRIGDHVMLAPPFIIDEQTIESVFGHPRGRDPVVIADERVGPRRRRPHGEAASGPHGSSGDDDNDDEPKREQTTSHAAPRQARTLTRPCGSGSHVSQQETGEGVTKRRDFDAMHDRKRTQNNRNQKGTQMATIRPCMWFQDNAETAVDFYVSVFPNAKILGGMPGPGGKAMAVDFQLVGQRFLALNGARANAFTEAVSFLIEVETQQEVDHLGAKLTADGGEESMCGWLKDKFGVSWQVVPTTLLRLMGDKDGAKAGRAMQAMMTMRKLDIAALQAAFDGA
jgi:predicted 3-demethylubiquinone-9 3-methyltransferase (glyoxalase superfamily)